MRIDKYDFISFISYYKTEKNVRLYLDIETLQYNEGRGRVNPSEFKNVTYSVAVSFYNKGNLEWCIFPNFKEFFDCILIGCTNKKTGKTTSKANYELIIHNGNKYDNHFMLHDLIYYYNVKRENLFLKNAKENDLTTKLSSLRKKDKESLVLEKRVKSSNNLELTIFLKGIKFTTTDNFLKSNMSIATLGKKLLKLGHVTDSELKTDFNYTEFNIDHDMSEQQAHDYALFVYHHKLSDNHITYIENDVILLAKSVRYYSELFPGFDYDKITFTSNILAYYNNNQKTSYQLLNEVIKPPHFKEKIQYTDYVFSGENFYDYLKPFYRGGLNLYNPKYLNKFVNDCFSMDINSSYPYVMYHEKIPYKLLSFDSYEQDTTIDIKDNEHYYLYRMSKESFNRHVLFYIDSDVVKAMLVKYYTTNDFVNINTFTIKLIRKLTGLTLTELPVLSWLEYECEYFGSRDEIAHNYFIKTQGKLKNKIIMDTPMDYTLLEEENTNQFSEEEINNAKVILNGLYGIPALRAHFNLFRLLPSNDLINIPNGYSNNERNILFSVFVTSVALYNLLSPLSYLTQSEIDDCFVYCDTDSLYLKNTIQDKIPSDLFDPIALGKWDIENNHIASIYVLNHKKYAYYSNDIKKGKPKGIVVKCGGVPLNAFNTNTTFKDFIENQFHHGAVIKNTKSIFNKQGTISIYESETNIDSGFGYPTYFSQQVADAKELLLDKIKQEHSNGFDDLLYIESSLGTFSQQDIYPYENETDYKYSLSMLQYKQNMMIKLIEESEEL